MRRSSLIGFLGSFFFHGIILLGIWLVLIHSRGSHGFKAPVVATHISMQMIQGMVVEDPQPIQERTSIQPKASENKFEVPDPMIKPEVEQPKDKTPTKKPLDPEKKKLSKQEEKKTTHHQRVKDMSKAKKRVDSQAKITSQATSNSKSRGHNPKLVGNGPQIDEIAAYENALRTEIEKQKRYPLRARMMRRQGTVLIRFMLKQSGELYDIRIEKTSGNGDLDRAALQAAQQARPIGLKPKGVSDTFVIPIHFMLN
ncbi:TonB family protein [Actinobacillus delphinicola]|uniref:TonB family protein n=1 Tax=Actinobacillus delphinicola TaxID=51161 RepID=A0A448TU73_9PAST|nr:energy transducer TonB [Actinobacillus delphinicola]VEJ09534.1 TonB family protein [Actinobacillus delphinicola]